MLRSFSRWLSAPVRRPEGPPWRPQLSQLEDRSTPASFAGNTITLDDANEVLTTATSVSGTYTLTSTVDVNGIAGPVAFTPVAGPVTVIDSATGTGLTFANSTAEYAHAFTVTLDTAPSGVLFSGTSSFAANSLSVTTVRNIVIDGGTNLTTTSGNITFSANQQATATGGNFIGVDVRETVSSVSGTVSVSGRGGNDAGGNQIGVRVWDGATIGSNGSGGVSVAGIGGPSKGSLNYGVHVLGIDSKIASNDGNVTVTGDGKAYSEYPGSGGSYNHGVFVNLGGRITAGGMGAVSVTGTAGEAGSVNNTGVLITDSGSSVTSSGGSVSVTGTGGGWGGNSDNENHGVLVGAGGRIAAGGAGVVSVTGATGGGISGPSQNYGVFVTGAGSAVTSTGGRVDILGVTAVYVSVVVADGGTIASGANAPVTITTDTLEVTGTGGISAGTGTVTIQPLNTAVYIGLGRYDHTHSYPSGPDRQIPRYLGLTDDELDRVTAGTLILGRSTTRTIEMYAPITRPTATAVQLVTAGDLLAVSSSPYFARFDTGGGPLTLSVGGRVNAGRLVTDLTASTVTFSPDARLSLAPNNPETYPYFNRLDVTGTLDLTGVSLVVGGNKVPAVGDVFTLVTASTLTGTFTGLPDGATIALNGVALRINYTANTATATAVAGLPPLPTPPSPPPFPRVVTAVGDAVTVLNPADGSTRTFVPFPGFSVSVASADLTGDRVPDVVVGAGPGGGPHVRVFDGATGVELASFFAFPVGFTGGVTVAAVGPATHVNAPYGQIVVGAGPGGGPQVKVIDASRLRETRPNGELADSALLTTFFAFDRSFAGGVRVAIADVTPDGRPEVVVGAGPGGGPHVKVIDGNRLAVTQPDGVISNAALLANFFAFDPGFTGGVSVAATSGRVAVGAGAGGGPHVKLYDGTGANVAGLFAFDPGFTGGVRVGFGDADADGDVDLLTGAGPGGGPHLKAFNLAPFMEVRSVFVGYSTDTRGVVV